MIVTRGILGAKPCEQHMDSALSPNGQFEP
ncbi:uncharacterized protein G2W53_011696 [Senna tora]|uniref:Uncharacterized protein n=1 Tax=Senna tora TaxID=362788 RepID=A0A835CFG4_9FABA|nr:uncharacterized protein G2W53_011696 [Senna tora]